MKRIVCIWLPNWPIQRLLIAQPELRQQPVVLYETRQGTDRVVACSAEAAALGVIVGMPMVEAKALRDQGPGTRGQGIEARDQRPGTSGEGGWQFIATQGREKAEGGRRKEEGGRNEPGLEIEKCKLKSANCLYPNPKSQIPNSPPLTPHPSPLAPHSSDPLADRRALEALAQWCGRFSPIVGLEDAATPECLLLDITGLAHLFDGEASLAEKILHDFACRGLTARVAIAETIGGAWAAAHFQRLEAEQGWAWQFIATREPEKAESGAQKPGGGGISLPPRGSRRRNVGGGTRNGGLEIEKCKLKSANCLHPNSQPPIPNPKSQIPNPPPLSIIHYPLFPPPSAHSLGGNELPPPGAISAFPLPPSAFPLPPSAFPLPSSAFDLLPVAALRLSEEVVVLLRQLGIERIGQLAALPRDELSSRFGPELLRRWDQATGRLAEPVPILAQPPTFEADWSPEHPITRRETVEAALEQLLGQVAQMLARLDRGALRLECRLDCIPAGSMRADPVRVSLGLFRPSASASHLASLVRLQLEGLRLPGPLSGIHVEAAATAPLPYEQQELFAPADGLPRRDPRDLAELIERLSSRLGHRLVLRPRLLRDAQPELAFCYDRLIEAPRRRRPKQAPPDLPPRPLCLLPRPILLAVITWGLSPSWQRVVPRVAMNCHPHRAGDCSDFRGATMGSSPSPIEPHDEIFPLRLLSFNFRSRSHRIAQHWGPERIETGWWRGRVVGRDYYQVETTTGHRYWLFRRLRDGRWFLHGTFE